MNPLILSGLTKNAVQPSRDREGAEQLAYTDVHLTALLPHGRGLVAP
jgi:hypothetical protein